jgi:APA family basic amino acid/polyamine antiporter
VASVAIMGVEAASGLAGEVRVGRRGLRRMVLASAAVALILFVGVSAAALMAQPVVRGETALGGEYLEAPVLGIVAAYDPQWLMEGGRYVVGATAAAVLIVGPRTSRSAWRR